MKWRVVGLETRDAYSNMALDNALVEGVRDGSSAPTIRFYRWLPSAVSIGHFQSMEDEVDVGRCDELGVSYVRRITGGGAVYHDRDGEITYSVIAPERLFPKSIIGSYRSICSSIISGLSALGIDAGFIPINDIVAKGRKVSGNAQTRKDGVLLQHGTVLYKTDVKMMFSLLKVSGEKISDKMIKSAGERVVGVSELADVSLEGLYRALLSGFTEGRDYELGGWSGRELRRTDELVRDVYSTRGWNFCR